MKIVTKKVKDIIPYDDNPRLIDEESINFVANSINEFGIKQPLVIDKDDIIIVGHIRLKACKKLGIKEVPCIIADDLTDEQVRAYRLADNKVAEFTDWDIFRLNFEFGDIDMDMSLFGFEEKEPTKPNNKVQISFSFNQSKGSFIKDYFAGNRQAKKDVANKIYDLVVMLQKEE